MKTNNSSNSDYGISENDLKSLIDKLKSNEKISDVILFGSRAKGNYKKGSDIDLAVKGNNLTLDDILEIRINLEEIMLPFKIDILDFTQITNLELLSHINRVGIKIG